MINSEYDVIRKSIVVNIDMKMIAIYSAKKTITNNTDLYSVLNPLTSSLSPSAKSNGDRLVSAKIETENKRNIIVSHILTLICFFCETSYIRNIIDDRRIMVMLTS